MLPASEGRVEAKFTRQVTNTGVDIAHLAANVEAQNLRFASGRVQVTHQRTDGGGLPGPVGTQEAEDLTASDL